MKGINNIRAFRNIEMELSLKVLWVENAESRESILLDLLRETVSKSDNTLPNIYMNLKMLSNWKKLYKDRGEEAKFIHLISANDKVNKTNKKIERFDELFEELPGGCYGSCTIPISYLRLIQNDNWKTNVLEKLRGSGSSVVEN